MSEPSCREGLPGGREVSAGLEDEVGRLGTEKKGQYRATWRGTQDSGNAEQYNLNQGTQIGLRPGSMLKSLGGTF